MMRRVVIYDGPSMYFQRNGIRRHENTELHDPVMVFLSTYNLIVVSTSDYSYGRYDELKQNIMPLQELGNLSSKITHPTPLIGKDVQYYEGSLHICPKIFMGRILRSELTLPHERFFGDQPKSPAPVSCWLYNHATKTLSAILTTFSKTS